MRRLSLIIGTLVLFTSMKLIFSSPHGSDFKMNCEDCHTTEGWAVNPDSMSFNHDNTAMALEGQHKETGCRACHQTLVFKDAETACSQCHTDIHENTVGQECDRCHTPNSWIVTDIIGLHRTTRFPLLGAHSMAECSDCHKSSSLLRFEPLGIECYDCHSDDFFATTSPNHQQAGYSTNCTDCHFMNGFTWTGAGINHDFFPLKEGHANIDCFRCHTDGTFNQIPNACNSCHQADYNATTNPNHTSLDFGTECNQCHTLSPGWRPAEFRQHDGIFPIYSGEHSGEWEDCSDCHKNSSNFGEFSCTDCHEHNQSDMNEEHEDVSGYEYNSLACLSCHPTGSGEGAFNHNSTGFPLTGAHIDAGCSECHINNNVIPSTFCYDCHTPEYQQADNPAHAGNDIPNTCADCHTTEPGWKPATFGIHNQFYALNGAHATIANDCSSCHAGNYITTPNSCSGCHLPDYDQTTNPSHSVAQFPTECEQCHSETAWQPSTFQHDGQYFPIYSGVHNSEWDNCSDCHTNASNFAIFECINCHEHNKADTDSEHGGIQGYEYTSQACFACHPDGSANGAFNHNNTAFPLTGAHTTAVCSDCHVSGYSGTTTVCFDCHGEDYNQSVNPNHQSLGIPNTCADCHTTQPGWEPATFAIHNQYYPLNGAHAALANNCATCHNGDYNNTPNTCSGCHLPDYNQTTNPNHAVAQFPTDCLQCHTENAWQPSTFQHDAQYFPIYSGQHQGEWENCSDCHSNPSNYSIFSCIDCHAHLQPDMDDEHSGIQGYEYTSSACLACHPDGSANGAFDHNNTSFPLTGAHTGAGCSDCHISGYTGTTTICSDCHADAYNQTTNPNHQSIGIPNTCSDCHTTNPGWQPATFPIHNQYYQLNGAHIAIANDCSSCHNGNYNSTPNTCSGCHMPDYNATTSPSHITEQFPTDCLICHDENAWIPSTFDHQNSGFPLTGAHTGASCSDCHQSGYSGTSTVCYDCHQTDFIQSLNPNHVALNIPNTCSDCHTTTPGWAPATFPIHNQYYQLNGAHAAIANDCNACHNGNYNNTPNTCSGCHMDDYNSTTNPNHAAAQYPTDCIMCHTEIAWEPSTFDHDNQYFPIYSGEHQGEWNTCSDCHPNPSNYAVFTCLTCHEQGETDEEHDGVSGYSYNSQACLNCHPDGSENKKINIQRIKINQ